MFCSIYVENLRFLKETDFIVKNDETGEYIKKRGDEMTKNRRENDEAEESGIIHETGKDTCPVKSFKK